MRQRLRTFYAQDRQCARARITIHTASQKYIMCKGFVGTHLVARIITVLSISLRCLRATGKLPLCRGEPMPQENYRSYCLDGAGHLHDAEWFYAENDGDAIAQILAKYPDGKCEIWQAHRLVARMSPAALRA